MDFCSNNPIDPVNLRTNLKFVALSVSEIIGGTQKIWAVLYKPTLPFLKNF